MHIQQKEDGTHGYFYYEEDGRKLAFMTYTWQANGAMALEHTEADEALKGRGAGKQLVDKAVALAREQGFKIIPRCPFVKHLFEKMPEEYQDVQ